MSDPRLRLLAGDTKYEDEALRLLDNTTIQVVAAGPLVEGRHQVVLYMLIDLLDRVFPRLDVIIDTATPAAAGLPPGGSTVGDRLAEVRRRSPLASLEAGPADIVVHIGPGSASADIVVDASEWQSYLGHEPSLLGTPRRECAIGPLIAACRAAAAVHNLVLAPIRPHTPMAAKTYFSALTYRQSTIPIDDLAPPPVGPLNALLVGGGSIGGAAAVAMSYEAGLSGLLSVCDPQKLDDSNPYRSVLATAEASSAKTAKAAEIKKVLSHHRDLKLKADEATITEWEANTDQPRALPLVLVAVDSLESRETVQDALPLEVVNAAVSGDELAISGHRTGAGPCMCCLHMPKVLDATAIKNRLIAEGTGITLKQVNGLRAALVPLNDILLRHIESHRRLESGSLGAYAGKTLDELYQAEILYGDVLVTTSKGTRLAVAAPSVTALAGVLLAGEAFKRSTPELRQYALGIGETGVRYWESPYKPHYGYSEAHVDRSPICLCRNERRLKLTAELYELDPDDLSA